MRDRSGSTGASTTLSNESPNPSGVVRYRYTPRALPMLLGISFFGACLAFFVYRGLDNQRGLVINRVIELDVDGATVFYWVFAALSACFVLAALGALASRALRETHLVLDEQALSVPSRWSKQVRVVPYSSIQGVELVTIQGQRLLYLATESGRVTVAGIMLESDELLRELALELTRRSRAPQ